MYSALDISKYVIAHEHSEKRDISNLRLQKLLYFIQAKYLVDFKEPCFLDIMEAWDFGPVVPSVYHMYKIFGSFNIQYNDKEPNIDSDTQESIKAILDHCSKFPTYQLIDITHKQDPWINARRCGPSSVITIASMKAYFIK